MIYGLQNNILSSPYSLIISILLLFGVMFVGESFQKLFLKKLNFNEYKMEYIFFSPIVGIYVLIFPLYILTIFELSSRFLFTSVSCLLLIFGIINFFSINKKFFFIKKKFKFKLLSPFSLVLIIFIGLFLISASPITEADSLDYHVHGAINILNLGKFHNEILPMHNTLVSIGEIVLTLGLAFKAEQFATLVQYSSILSLIPIFKKKDEKNYSMLLFILSCPIIFFLVSSPKPQLLFSIASFIIFILLVNKFKSFKNKDLKLIFPIIILILSINYLVKYSFFLSSSLLAVYLFYLMSRRNLILYSIISSLIIFAFTLLPLWYFRYNTYGTGLPDLILSPLPLNIYGYNEFHSLLGGGTIPILGLFFPNSLIQFSTTYGPSLLIILFLFNSKMFDYKIPLLLIVIFLISVLIFGSNQSRFLLEGILWYSYLIKITLNEKKFMYKVFDKTVLVQSIIILFAISIFVVNIFPGSISQDQREQVMKKYASGYSLADWANKSLDDNAVVLSTHRSISLFNNKTYSEIFTWLINFDQKETKVYSEVLKKNKINSIVFYGKTLKKAPFTDCLGKELYYKKNVGKITGRNPFSEGEAYNGWIFEFKHELLPNCLIN